MDNKINYKFAFYVLAFVWMCTISGGCYIIYNTNQTLNNIHAIMDDDRISKYIKAGWMPPIDYTKHKSPTPMKPKEY